MKYIAYSIVSRVLETWSLVRRFKDENETFEQVFGRQILYKFLQLQPAAQAFYKSDQAMGQHAAAIVQLFDSVFQMLGPDLEFVEDILKQIGHRHAAMGVQTKFFLALGQSLLWAIDQRIGDEMDDEDRGAWQIVFDMISADIIKGMQEIKSP